MKKHFLAFFAMTILALSASAQKFALVDMEYILSRIPAYERAGEQLNQVSKKWQTEVEVLQDEAQAMYKKYQSEAVFLSDEQKVKQEEAIIAKEKEASDLKKKYFGPEGELFKKRESLMAPIQDEIYNAIKDLAEGLQVTAVSADDSVIEAVEAPGDRYILGVQWHPEELVEFPEARELFRSFVDAAAK